jgi:hypothetical protein
MKWRSRRALTLTRRRDIGADLPYWLRMVLALVCCAACGVLMIGLVVALDWLLGRWK